MMRLAKKEEIPAVMALWQEAFEDTQAEIADFFASCGSEIRVCIWEEDSEIRAQLILLPVTILCKREYGAEYIYALAVKKVFRGKGLATKLLEEVGKLLLKENKAGILVPAEESLIEFYEKRGFEKCFAEEKYSLTFPSKGDMTTDMTWVSRGDNPACFKEIGVMEYQKLRRDAFEETGFVELSLHMLSYAVDSVLKAGGKCVEITACCKKYGVLYRQNHDGTALELLEITAANAEDTQMVAGMMAGFIFAEGGKVTVRRSCFTMGMNLPTQLLGTTGAEKVIFNLVLN